jgi:hypothetical protein
MEKHEHQNSFITNQEVNWFQLDSEEYYQKNLAERRSDLERFGWIDKTISYKFNSCGFRSDEFDGAPNVMFIGCSHTLGLGLPVEQTFSHIISTELNLKNFNLGVAGSSNDTAFRLAYHYIPKLKPSMVIFLSTERTRFELFTEDNSSFILSYSNRTNSLQNVKEEVKGFYRHWIVNDNNIDLHYTKNILAIKQICLDNNIKFYQKEFLNFPMMDKARDLAHYGVKSNMSIAKKILSDLAVD